MPQGPFRDGVGDGAGEMKGGKGVEAFYVASFPDAGDPVAIVGAVLLVGITHDVFADGFLGLSYAAG